MRDFGETVIRQTIEMLFEEQSTHDFILDYFFQALVDVSEHFDIPQTNVVNIILETGERKNFENGAVAAQFMSFLRQLKKGPWQPLNKY